MDTRTESPRLATVLPWSPLVASALVALMVAGGFAMLAIIPVSVVVFRTFRDQRLRQLRPWAGVLAVAFATPLVLWGALPERAPSLTKDMHPAFAVGIVVAALAYGAAYLVLRRKVQREGRQ